MYLRLEQTLVARLASIVVALFLVLTALHFAEGQPSDASSSVRWQWKVFGAHNSNLPSDQVSALALSPAGELWVATYGGGLARLHKGLWDVFTVTNSSLPDDRVQSLASGPHGELWIGTQEGLARFHEGSWRVFTAANSGLPNNDVSALTLSPVGELWVGTQGGLARLHEGSWDVFTMANSSLPNDRVRSLVTGPHGELWVGSSSRAGLARFHNNSWKIFTSENSSLPTGGHFSLVLDADGALWVGTPGALSRFHEGSWEVFTAENSDLPRLQVGSLAVGPTGELWIGTGKGLAQFNEGSWEVFTAENSPLPGSGNVLALAVGPGGEVWVGTQEGALARLDQSSWDVFTSAVSKLPADNIGSLALGPDGELWVGTLGSGLARFHKDSWESFTLVSHQPTSGYNWVTSLVLGPEGELWTGTMDGLARFHGGSWEVFRPAASQPINDWVTSLALGPDRELWIGTIDVGTPENAGLARFHAGSWEVFSATDTGLPMDRVKALALGREGQLWIGTAGLARLHDGSWEVFAPENSSLPSELVSSLALGSEQDLWVGTVGGLAHLHDGSWKVFTEEDTDLPDDWVLSLATGLERELWVGTESGLARLHEGSWNVFTTANSSLPDDEVSALALSSEGDLWVGTRGGLARFRFSEQQPQIVDLVGAAKSARAQRITQNRHTFAVVPFDPSYRTEGLEWRFQWRLEPPSGEARTVERRSPYFDARFEQDGEYILSVQAIDVNGFRSDPYVHKLEVALPTETPLDVWVTRGVRWGSLLAGAYFLALFPLLGLYPRAGWARSLVNSGAFSRFPVLHRIVLNTTWARRRVFRCLAERALENEGVPEPYIPQQLAFEGRETAPRVAMDATSESLSTLFGSSRKVLVLGRSGTGKSVLLRFLERELARRFLLGEDSRIPVFIDLRTSPVTNRDLGALVRDALRGGGHTHKTSGVELPAPILDHLITKGGFILLIDSLNELPRREDVQALHPFFNREAANFTIIASQVDLLERTDFATCRLAEVTQQQARAYLTEVLGRDTWEKLPTEARALASNPQDLEFLGEILQAIGPERPLPSRRAELYREILYRDALADWARAGGAAIRSLYALAFRMVRERRVVGEEQLREWLRGELNERDAFTSETMDEVEAVIGKSRLFRREEMVDVLGQRRPVTGFRHELVGKFLASRHIREVLFGPDREQREEYLALSSDEEWLEAFYFTVDELDSRTALAELLEGLLEQGRSEPLRILAYAIGSKPAEMIPDEIHQAYSRAKLGEDLAQTPVGGEPRRHSN